MITQSAKASFSLATGIVSSSLAWLQATHAQAGVTQFKDHFELVLYVGGGVFGVAAGIRALLGMYESWWEKIDARIEPHVTKVSEKMLLQLTAHTADETVRFNAILQELHIQKQQNVLIIKALAALSPSTPGVPQLSSLGQG